MSELPPLPSREVPEDGAMALAFLTEHGNGLGIALLTGIGHAEEKIFKIRMEFEEGDTHREMLLGVLDRGLGLMKAALAELDRVTPQVQPSLEEMRRIIEVHDELFPGAAVDPGEGEMIMTDHEELDYNELADVLAKTSMAHAVEVMNLFNSGANAPTVRTCAQAHASELITPLSVLIEHLGLTPEPGAAWHHEDYDRLDALQMIAVAARHIALGTGNSTDGRHEPQHLTLALAALTWLVTPDDPSALTG